MARALFETALQRQANPGLRLQLGAQQQEAPHRLLSDVGELRLGRQIDQGGGARPRDGGKQGTAARLAVGGSDRIDHLRWVRRIARRRDHAGAARDRRRQRGAIAQRLEIEIAQLRRLDDGQRLAALGDLDAGGDRQRLEADQGANDGRLRIAQHACGHLGVREVDGHQRRAVDLAGRHVGSGKGRGGVALQHPAGGIGAAGKRFGELRLADHGAGALSFARQHQRVGHCRGDRRIGIAAGIAHHLVQALRLAHGGELLDLEHEQAGRRTAVRRRWRELAHQDLELQIAQGAAARRIGQRRRPAAWRLPGRFRPRRSPACLPWSPSGSRWACRRNWQPARRPVPPSAPRAPRPAAAKLAREAFIGDGDLEVPHGRTGLEHGKCHHAGNQEADDNDGDHRPKLQGGHAELISGTEQGHDAGNLPRLAPKRQSRTILIVFGEPLA